MNTLDQHLLVAHAADDRPALVRLYAQAADAAADINAACFFLTHAYIYALEQNHADTQSLHARLVAHGREE